MWVSEKEREMGKREKRERKEKRKEKREKRVLTHIWSPPSDVRPRTSAVTSSGFFLRCGVQHCGDDQYCRG